MKVEFVIHKPNEKITEITKYIDDGDIFETVSDILLGHNIEKSDIAKCVDWCEDADYGENYYGKDFEVYTSIDW